MNPRKVSNNDRFIGLQIRRHRRAAGRTLDDLATHLGISYQQAHKYENGTNRVTAGAVYEISQYLQLPIEVFFPATVKVEDEPPAKQALALISEAAAILEANAS